VRRINASLGYRPTHRSLLRHDLDDLLKRIDARENRTEGHLLAA
jgi:hypothetical protein